MIRRRSQHPMMVRRSQPWWVNWLIANAADIQLWVLGLALVPIAWVAAVAALRVAAWWNG